MMAANRHAVLFRHGGLRNAGNRDNEAEADTFEDVGTMDGHVVLLGFA
jgi:hypothetical protein